MVQQISLINAGKKYYREWIFRNANVSFSAGQKVSILGPNGSGKSTLLQVIGGAVMPNEGNVIHSNGAEKIADDEVYRSISFASPYLELIEEFTLAEIISFHFKFRKPAGSLTPEHALEITGLASMSDKQFRYFSSGMKQRVKLALAFLSDTSVLLLDEPCSNLDSKGIGWYRDMITTYSGNRLVIIASNQNEYEYDFCDSGYEMAAFKQ